MNTSPVRRAGALVIAIALAVAAAPMVVTAAGRRTGEGEFAATRQAFQWRTDDTTTTSTRWRRLVLFGEDTAGGGATTTSPLRIASRGGMSVTVSADFAGAPVQLRVRDGDRVLRPGRASFDPAGRATSTSFTFVAGRTGAAACRSVWVEWRSPTGDRVRFDRGDVVVTYRPEAPAAGPCN